LTDLTLWIFCCPVWGCEMERLQNAFYRDVVELRENRELEREIERLREEREPRITRISHLSAMTPEERNRAECESRRVS
jgi:hypothetical protein